MTLRPGNLGTWKFGRITIISALALAFMKDLSKIQRKLNV